jgi:hypothetical protein
MFLDCPDGDDVRCHHNHRIPLIFIISLLRFVELLLIFCIP